MLRCNCSSPGRSAARRHWPTKNATLATMMDARQKPRRGAPSGVMDTQCRKHSLRHWVRRNGRAPAPRRGRTPPAAPAERQIRTRNCRSAISRSRDPQTTVNGRARKPADRRRNSWPRMGLARWRPWRSPPRRSRRRKITASQSTAAEVRTAELRGADDTAPENTARETTAAGSPRGKNTPAP